MSVGQTIILIQNLLMFQWILCFEYSPLCNPETQASWTRGSFQFSCQKIEGNETFGRVKITGCVRNRVPSGYVQGCNLATAGAEVYYSACLQNAASNLTCPEPLTTARNADLACISDQSLIPGTNWLWDTVERGEYKKGYGRFKVLCETNSDSLKSTIYKCVDAQQNSRQSGEQWVEGETSHPGAYLLKKCLIDSVGGKIYSIACVDPLEPVFVRENGTIWRSANKTQLLTCALTPNGTERSDVRSLPLKLAEGQEISEDLRQILDENEDVVACLSSDGQKKENDTEWQEYANLLKCEISADRKSAQIVSVISCEQNNCTESKKDNPIPPETTESTKTTPSNANSTESNSTSTVPFEQNSTTTEPAVIATSAASVNKKQKDDIDISSRHFPSLFLTSALLFLGIFLGRCLCLA